MEQRNWVRKVLSALILVLAGLVILPALVYLVGVQVVGEYEGSDGIGSLYAAIYTGLFEGSLATWMLVLSPLAVVLLVRVAAALRRAR